jgi:hypothetical protein
MDFGKKVKVMISDRLDTCCQENSVYRQLITYWNTVMYVSNGIRSLEIIKI